MVKSGALLVGIILSASAPNEVLAPVPPPEPAVAIPRAPQIHSVPNPVPNPVPKPKSDSAPAAISNNATKKLNIKTGKALSAPTLSMGNLCDEMARTAFSGAKEKSEIAQEKQTIAKERAELQELSKNITQAREQLKIETARLISFIDLAQEESKSESARCKCKETDKTLLSGKNSLELLSKTVRSMKPEQAANLIATLDRNFGAALLIRMRPSDSSSVMNRLPPPVAAELMVIMAATPPPEKETKQ